MLIFSPERFKPSVDIHISAVARHKVDRADAVVERKMAEIVGGRAPFRSEIVDFHGGVQMYAVGVEGLQSLHLCQVFGHALMAHVARRVYGHG